MTAKTIMLAFVCAVAMAGLLGPGGQSSSGQQQDPRNPGRPASGCYVCGSSNIPGYVIFDDADWFGILAEDACPVETYLRDNPARRESLCQKIKSARKFTSFAKSCREFAKYCEPDGSTEEKTPPDKKCEKPNPWFGGSGGSSNCREVQSPVVRENAGGVTLTICGLLVFRWVPPDNDPNLIIAYQPALREWVKARVGSKVCCDKFRESARTGTPCYPGADIDCDGIPNPSDVHTDEFGTSYPDINNLFTKPEGAPIDPFPPGLDPDDTGFLPPQEKCDCKWELVKGKLNCSPDGRQRHYYEARWRCPSTGNERYTRKFAPATAPCP